MNRLRDMALESGAARGIGEAIARAFVNEGALVLVYLSDIDDARGVPAAERLGSHAQYSHLDVREERDWTTSTSLLIDTHGGIDIVVNNAGITGFEDGELAQDPENATLDARRAVHRTNLDGVFLGCKYAIKAMRPRGAGSIINISSRSGLVGIPGAAAYVSSKAAVRNHTKSVALHCAEQGSPDPLQFDPPGSDPHAHVETHAGHRPGSRRPHGGIRQRHALAPLRTSG
jgi:NAD(P)-dependent dehydrogenase (short-subunit alcohol dehydrogenase family)